MYLKSITFIDPPTRFSSLSLVLGGNRHFFRCCIPLLSHQGFASLEVLLVIDLVRTMKCSSLTHPTLFICSSFISLYLFLCPSVFLLISHTPFSLSFFLSFSLSRSLFLSFSLSLSFFLAFFQLRECSGQFLIAFWFCGRSVTRSL